MEATLSILGLYNYDKTIFDKFVLPTGADVETAKNLIFAECAELELLYANPELMKKLIGNWCKALQYKWEKLWNTTTLEYNPIENYSMTEQETTDGTNKGTVTDNGTNGGTRKTEGARTSVYDVASFNVAEVETANKTTETYEPLVTDDYTESNTNTRDLTSNEKRSLTRSGNIGVTTSQAMIERERSVADFNFYEVVVDDFKNMFCLEVY